MENSSLYNSYKTFSNNEFGEIRVLEVSNEPWFVGKDVAEILGYKDINRAVKQHIDKEDLKVCNRKGYGDLYPTLWNNKNDFANKVLINESGLYSLILNSKLPNAKKFKKWVTGEVLPSIRKHGAYMTENTIEKALASPDFLIQLATKLKEEQEKAKLLEQQLETNSKMIRQIEASKNSLLVREVAKVLSNKHSIVIGEKRLYNKLREWGWVFKNSTEAKQEAIRHGYLEVRERVYETVTGPHTGHVTRVTGKGQRKILEKLLEELEEKAGA